MTCSCEHEPAPGLAWQGKRDGGRECLHPVVNNWGTNSWVRLGSYQENVTSLLSGLGHLASAQPFTQVTQSTFRQLSESPLKAPRPLLPAGTSDAKATWV